ncbi:MAG TPA: PAS domain S-box protein, partial [bacterium]
LVAAIIVGSVLLAYLLSRILQKQISMPILALAETAQAISNHRDFSIRAKKYGEDELGLLTDAFNQMLAEILVQEQALKATQVDLAEKNVFLNSVMENMSEGLVVADIKGKMLFFNRSAKRISGIGASQETLENWSKEYGVFHEDGVTPYPSEENPIALVLQGEEPNNVIQFLRNSKNPNGVYVTVNGRPIRDELGQIKAGIVVVRDITEQRRVEEHLKSYTKKLEESNRDLQDFIFVASHDLQEPLRKIQSFGNFLKEEAGAVLTSTATGHLSKVLDAARRMSGLIEDLLLLTRITTKAKPFEPVDLSEIAKDVLSDLELKLKESGGKVEVGELPRLEADQSQMLQLLHNLVGNALKYHKPGAPPIVQVTGETDPKKGQCRIRVKDNGIGF